MTEGMATRYKALEDQITRLADTISQQTSIISQVLTMVACVKQNSESIDEIQKKETPLDSPILDTPPTTTFNLVTSSHKTDASHKHDPLQNIRLLKLEIPTFSGSNVSNWLFQIERFFEYHKTPPEHRLYIASFYVSGDALEYYQWLHSTNQLTSWESFSDSIKLRFGPSSYINHEASLYKLQQTSSVNAYILEFTSLSNRVTGLSHTNLLNCFLFGLKEDIKRELFLLKPQSLADAIGMAKLVEDKLQPTKWSANRFFQSKPTTISESITSKPQPPPLPPISNLNRAPPHPIHRLTPTEMANRRAKGLCYNCDEQFHQGHRCRSKQFLCLLATDDDNNEPHPLIGESPSSDCVFQDNTTQTTSDVPTISYHALEGHFVPSTLRLMGQVNGKPITVLIDGGSTHNFMQTRVAKFLGLPILPSEHLQVTLGNGASMHCAGCCKEVSLRLDNYCCTLEFYLLPIYGADMPINESLPHDFHDNLEQLLHGYSDVFALPKGLPPQRQFDHHIPLLPNFAPVNVRPFRYPHFQKNVLENLVQEMLDEGLIQHSSSPFSFPALLVKKKDGTWRFCVDYRALNAVTVKDRFPIPTVDELSDELYGSEVFSKLDLRAGYHQLRIHPSDVYKTAFRTHVGHYEFIVMPFGLSNAPSTFQSTMNEIFRPVLRKFVLVFFDDILIYSKSWELHMEHLNAVFSILRTHQFFVKLSKCEFGSPSVFFLGHIISAAGVSIDPAKVEAIQTWPEPKTIKQLRGFLGLASYYRRFVQGFASISSPLSNLLRKDAFIWDDKARTAFSKLKIALLSTPVLALPNFEEPFTIYTDASGVGIGAVLLQHGHPLAYFSKIMCLRMQKASTYIRELYAITEAVRKWRQYLLGRKFIIVTDHQSLRTILHQNVHTPDQQHWITKLLGYDFDIMYQPGKDNGPADALSRLPESSSSTFFALTQPDISILGALRDHYETNSEAHQLYQDVVTQGCNVLWPRLRPLLLGLTSEVVNRCLEDYLRCFVSDYPKAWVRFLPWAEWSYNTSLHSSIGMTPFEAVYGRSPPCLLDYVNDSTKVASVGDWLKDRTQVLHKLKENLQRAQVRMRNKANAHRTEVEFDIGDWVFVKLQPYRQSSVANRRSYKLSKRFFGPFQITSRIGAVAYRVALPEYAKIHNVFHVSLLKKCLGDPTINPNPLPNDFFESHPLLTPAHILDHRQVMQQGHLVTQLLVQWNGQSISDATWEPLKEFMQDFPDFPLEDKVVSHRGSNDACQNNMGHVSSGSEVQQPRKSSRAIMKPSKYKDFI
ncbi:ty3-gypsy retrotransposon protein [Tanacetum coccineum]